MSTLLRFLYAKVSLTGILCSVIFFVSAQVTIEKSNNHINLYFNNEQRLLNGVAVTASKKQVLMISNIKNDVAVIRLVLSDTINAQEFAGIFFDNIPHLKQGITFWRYKPWNSWSKPIAIRDASKMQAGDIQFFYWQHDDGVYGAAVPLSGNGYRTTLGSESNKWGSKAISYANNSYKEVPAMAVGFGNDPFELFARIYKTAFIEMGRAENMASIKTLPEPFQYIGWCTWNSSNMGKDLNEQHIIEGVKTFTEKKFPLGWVLVDDGWFQHDRSRLQSKQPDPKKFPDGFGTLIKKLKTSYGIKYAGIWHAFNGYWNGIDPNSSLGNTYKNELYSWSESQKAGDSSLDKTYYFIKPEGNHLFNFYNSWHQYFKHEGFDFVKVDNQLVVERMAVNNYPIFNLSTKMHKALYRSINANFKGAVINCMDMTADAYLNFGTSATARAVEDYFPYKEKETYDLEKGNAAAHVLQAIYNAVYFSQMVYPDFDMFQSNNPNAVFHALARTLNNGPIYLTDKPGEQNFDILNRLVYADGKTIRSQTALLPTEDCLFQVQDPKLFKAYSKTGKNGLLVLYNAADAEAVMGSFKPSDVNGLMGDQFAVYEYFSHELKVAGRNDSFSVQLPRLGYKLEYIIPIKNNYASFGLINKYNAPSTILSEIWTGSSVNITLYEGGQFKAYSKQKPATVTINDKVISFTYEGNIISVDIPGQIKSPKMHISW